ncbi:2-keto-3-deoxy-L-lyxonate dehydratase, partial [Listeria monocytogenes]|nr:2-keto-3-deoxy-L-lyxonate dehydratase [Listeria monocytogenes]
ILRDGEVLWQQAFLSGEDNMCHSLENLESHHFKYAQFLRPGDVHVHYFGTATLSFADGIKAAPGDVFEIAMAEFGAPLRNGIAAVETALTPGRVVAL